ncbi:T-complex protein 1 subunit zeta [Nosema granulosis]|uniref:T-complex protein 1 subunit zeta n=1 Tax=Nosema granulosis TaxID=83296 RepID=A0A9P6KY69_9MICR|nr:T-complex protein 1 subunit zeta [Nosema granulosis]
MQSTQSDAQITQSGQAIKINNSTALAMKELFSVTIGPNGTFKGIITPGQTLTITKNGNILCKDIQFINPTSIVLTKAASSLYNTYGDGSSTFITLSSDIFTTSYKYICDGVPITSICNALQVAMSDVSKFVEESAITITGDIFEKLAFNLLNTKVSKGLSKILSPILVRAIKNISESKFQDVNMVEVIKMNEGDASDTRYVDGLVLDHAGRHYAMPTEMDDVCIMVTNMSLEYEKPEIAAQFVYSNAEQRESLIKHEREFILAKARAIAAFATELKNTTGKALLVISEKGIDPYSLDILAKANVLALRRAKRRNLERLLYMCGGNIISQVNQLDVRNLGYCQRVRTRSLGEDKYTFVEGTPFKGSCTILVRGSTDNQMRRMESAIRASLKALHVAYTSKKVVAGGSSLYKNMVAYLRKQGEAVDDKLVVGYNILEESFTNLIKTLIRNKGSNIQEELIKVMRNKVQEDVYDSLDVVQGVITNSTVICMSLLMVDEIIRAGKCIKEDKLEQ